MGALDFNKHCMEEAGNKFPPYGVAIYYRRCKACGFVFTEAFDAWTEADFARHIYNDDYIKIDPGYDTFRPAANAELVADLLAPRKDKVSILDFGGGNGRFAEHMRAAGFATCDTYDPFNPAFATPPPRQYDVVTCFETLEHTPDPLGTVAAISAFLAGDGAVIFSTVVQPANFQEIGLSWWYIGPRNGHISIYSKQSLDLLWNAIGFSVSSPSDNLHLAFRGSSPALA
jgi:2-polyprenyl-6-hydroxyphenyl methylase/3-demethylubiquinone-9 3-methyltransferase